MSMSLRGGEVGEEKRRGRGRGDKRCWWERWRKKSRSDVPFFRSLLFGVPQIWQSNHPMFHISPFSFLEPSALETKTDLQALHVTSFQLERVTRRR